MGGITLGEKTRPGVEDTTKTNWKTRKYMGLVNSNLSVPVEMLLRGERNNNADKYLDDTYGIVLDFFPPK